MITGGRAGEIVPFKEAECLQIAGSGRRLRDHHEIAFVRGRVMRESQFARLSDGNVIEDCPGTLDFLSTRRICSHDAVYHVSIIVSEFAIDLPVVHEGEESEMRIYSLGPLLHVAYISGTVEPVIFVEVVYHPGSQVGVLKR